jgi:plasmid replication initiation protein
MSASQKKHVIKKSNALINAAYTITLSEQRLILLAIVSARGDLEKMAELTVHAQDYAEQFGVSLKTAYEAMQYAASQLFERRFTFQQESKKGLKTTVSRWVSHVTYIEGEGSVSLAFAPHVQPLLCDLQEKFAYYDLEQIADLTSVHAVRLYELLIAWRSTGKTPVIAIADFRRQLGIEPDDYKRMTDFKRWVLESAIKQINEHTDITVSYQQHKRGRSISGFEFRLRAKKPVETRKKLTKQQAEAMARPGESYSQLYKRLSSNHIILGES